MSADIIETAPLTRAQRFQWFLEEGLAEGLLPLPAGTSADTAQGIVHGLERRFDALRTSIAVVDRELGQRVHSSGSPMRVADIEPDATPQQCMARLVEEFKARVQGRIGVFLVQFHLLRKGEQRWLAFVANHPAMDADFRRVVEQAMAQAAAGPPDDAAGTPLGGPAGEARRRMGIQPAEMARLESGPDGATERAQASAHLREHFSAAPARMHPCQPSAGTGGGRYYRSTLTLHGADIVFARLMSTTGTLPSATILAAFAQLLCWRAETDGCVVNVARNNRHNAALRRVLCTTAQRAPTTFRRDEGSMRAATAHVQKALAHGHPAYGRYDPFDLLHERVAAQHRRGINLSTDLAFNFILPPQGWPEVLKSADKALSRTASDITCAATDEVFYEYGASLSVRWSGPGTSRISVHGDSRVLPPEQCAALLRGIERVVTHAAEGRDRTADGVARDVGLERVPRGPGERRIGGHWFDLRAVEERLLALDGVDGVELIPDSAPETGTTGVTARVSVSDGTSITPQDLRDELLRFLDTGELLAVPDHYEIVGAAPAGGGPSAPRPAVTAEEAVVRDAVARQTAGAEPDLDSCYLLAGGQLAQYPEFADRLRRHGYVPPGFAVVSGMTTLRILARELRGAGPDAE